MWVRREEEEETLGKVEIMRFFLYGEGGLSTYKKE